MGEKLRYRKNVWLSSVVDSSILRELSMNTKIVTKDYRCTLCKGGRLLCGRTRCPILVRLNSELKVAPLIDKLSIDGSAPGIFVGRIGWPYVFVGPLITPFHGDTSLLNTPELWQGKTIEEIVDFRSQLVRGKYRVHVKNVTEGKIVELTREIALSKISPETTAEFTKKPSRRLILDEDVQPIGPSAPLKDLDVGSIRTDQRIEKAFSDIDLKAAEAVIMLYKKGVVISRIQTAFSAGLLGIGKKRCFVPTRMSITAVDSIISQNLLEKVKSFPLINEFRVYEHTALDNRWIVLMIPEYWSYEQMEAWYPKTTWNPNGKSVWIISDWEGFKGRTTYALTGGCYYSTRLAICEGLVKEKRQATVITFREIHPGYIIPVGVWHTRESIREALKKEPSKFNKLEDALKYISTKLAIPLENWIKNTHLLRSIIFQRKLMDYLKLKI